MEHRPIVWTGFDRPAATAGWPPGCDIALQEMQGESLAISTGRSMLRRFRGRAELPITVRTPEIPEPMNQPASAIQTAPSMEPTRRGRFALMVMAILALTGCELLGIEDPAKVAAAVEADGKAIGAACRHAARAIEDCYARNPRASKAAVFAGWREMNDYMAENKIEPVKPTEADKDKMSLPGLPPGFTLPAMPAAPAAAETKAAGKP
jgi:hypothetical protein